MMIKKETIIQAVIILLIGFNPSPTFGQQKNKKMKLMQVEYELVVDVTPEKAWTVLANYGNVAAYHSGLISSHSLNGSGNEAVLGCDRQCVIPNGKKEIVVREKIIEIVDGQYYTYDVYDWENFPLNKMINTFGVKTNSQGQTVIYQKTEYRLRPRFLTWLMKGKLRKGSRENLLGYKHYMETNEKNVAIKILKEKYKNS